jgi:hypothetical protein
LLPAAPEPEPETEAVAEELEDEEEDELAFEFPCTSARLIFVPTAMLSTSLPSGPFVGGFST